MCNFDSSFKTHFITQVQKVMVQAYHASKPHFKSSMNESLNLQKKNEKKTLSSQ